MKDITNVASQCKPILTWLCVRTTQSTDENNDATSVGIYDYRRKSVAYLFNQI